MAAGFNNVGQFRDQIYKTPNLEETLKLSEDFFHQQSFMKKRINDHESFMTSGHG